jgi:hypothetical protein
MTTLKIVHILWFYSYFNNSLKDFIDWVDDNEEDYIFLILWIGCDGWSVF